jgi:hypothetical protein
VVVGAPPVEIGQARAAAKTGTNLVTHGGLKWTILGGLHYLIFR